MPDNPPRQNKDQIDDTIDEQSEVDEASLESFPASDAPAWTNDRIGPADVDQDQQTPKHEQPKHEQPKHEQPKRPKQEK